MATNEIRVLDLFAGAGGLTAGLHAASSRFRTVAAVEMDPSAAASYEATFGKGVVYAGSIQSWLQDAAIPTDIDVVIGGPPCQGFSTLGKQSLEDERNGLWRHYASALVLATPKYFVVENVAAFRRSSQYEQFVEATTPLGFLKDYAFEHRVLNAADYGAPQARKRSILIGHHRDLPAPGFPSPSHAAVGTDDLIPHVTVGEILSGVPTKPDREYDTSRIVSVGERKLVGPFAPRETHWARTYSDLSLRRFAAIPRGGGRRDLPESLMADCWVKHKTGSYDVMGRLHADRPSVTIRTEFFKPEKGRYLHPTADRAITHYEAALLQGFPESHRFVGSKVAIARQIGNAVPIPLGAAIGKLLLERL